MFFIVKLGHSQTIQGNVRDSEENDLIAKILIEPSNNLGVISEFILVRDGKFSYDLKKSYYEKGFYINVTATGYNSHIELIKPSDIRKTMNFNFILTKEKIEILEEVFVKGYKRPISVKKDTVVYNVESFKDGTEKKVEDLLKKLPGIKINDDTGIIKYKGTTIETVTIEGDNLFDYNYTIGTKNINIDLVKEIEAIDNYSENELLKDIEKSGKVAINLKLKENNTDLSLSTDLGIGHFIDSENIPMDLSINSLAINKKQKTFTVSTYNNIGKNNTPFNYFENQISIEKIKEDELFTEKIIPEYNLPKVTGNNLSNINNQFFGNVNSIFSFSNKAKAKLNLFYFSDNIESNQFSESKTNVNNTVFNTFDNNFIKKKPMQYRGDLELKFNVSKSSLIKYNISFRDEIINTEKKIISNQKNDFTSSLKSSSVFLKQELEYTKKISKKNALQLNLTNSINNLNQTFIINPSIFNSIDFDQDNQENNTKKLFSSFKAVFLGKTQKGNNYSFSTGYNFSSNLFLSHLSSLSKTQNSSISNSKNNLNLSNVEVYTKGSYNWYLGRFTISPKYSFRYLNLRLKQQNLFNNATYFIFEPSLNISYKINRTSSLNFFTNLKKTNSPLRHLFRNKILIDNRLIKSNEPNLELQESQIFNLFFSKSDLFNQLEMYLGVRYVINKGNFFNNIFINESSSIINSIFLPENTNNLMFNFNISKLIYPLKTTFKFSTNYSIYNSKNIVNNSNLRSNKSDFLINSFFLKTSFSLPFNIENKTTFNFQRNRSINTFSNKSLENDLKLIFKPFKDISATISNNYYIPSLDNSKNHFYFLSSKILYTPKNKSWKLGISGVNLLNKKSYVEENTTDISNNITRVNLLERYFLFNFSYSF